MKLEYEEAVDALAVAEYQADVDEATEHLTAAINALVKVDAGTGSERTDDTMVLVHQTQVQQIHLYQMLRLAMQTTWQYIH